MNILIITGTVTILASVFFFMLKRSHNKALEDSLATETDKKDYMPVEEAEKIVLQLEKAGYFKYADPNDLDTLKKILISSIATYGILSTEYNERTLIPNDYRLYVLDGETIFEQGGFTDALIEMKSLFDKMNIKIEINDHLEEFNQSKQVLNHRITINSKRYIIFEDFDGYGWGEAAQRFAEIINDQLALQQTDERLYLINGANDGACIYLTEEQFSIIDIALDDERWKPLRVADWCRVFEVNPSAYIRNGN